MVDVQRSFQCSLSPHHRLSEVVPAQLRAHFQAISHHAGWSALTATPLVLQSQLFDALTPGDWSALQAYQRRVNTAASRPALRPSVRPARALRVQASGALGRRRIVSC